MSENYEHNCLGQDDDFYTIEGVSGYEFRVHDDGLNSTHINLSFYPTSIPLTITGIERVVEISYIVQMNFIQFHFEMLLLILPLILKI
jgi:hypothetical protein